MYWLDSPVRGMSITTVGAVGADPAELSRPLLPKMEPDSRPLPAPGRATGASLTGRDGLGECEAVETAALSFGEGFFVVGLGPATDVSVSISIASAVRGMGPLLVR